MGKVKKAVGRDIKPVVALRGITVFPHMILPFDVGRAKSIKSIEQAMNDDQKIVLVTQKYLTDENPSKEGLYNVGTYCEIKQLLRLPDNNIRILVEGIKRVDIIEYTRFDDYIEAEVEAYEMIEQEDDKPTEYYVALLRQLRNAFEDYAMLNGKIPKEAIEALAEVKSLDMLTDTLAAHIAVGTNEKQEILDEYDEEERMMKLVSLLAHECDVAIFRKEIDYKVKGNIEKVQREVYLREQIKVIKSELGEEDLDTEIDEYRQKIKGLNLSKAHEEKLDKELKKLSRLSPMAPESGILRSYLDLVLDLPWNDKSEVNNDIVHAREILDDDHYGLDKVKDRIIEFLAVKQIKSNLKGSIICLVGPPGVGKTSIARSIARAVNRKYVRLSLGGIHDESEIRGHRRTYVGAMPGRIISALKEAKTSNPLILFDEIDKMSSDFRGDPASAMLEVLDAEQNNTFRDNYLELTYDLSDVMFITTANSIDKVPEPLRDRMEIIELSSYTSEEKYHIAAKHLVPKQIEENGLKKSQIVFKEAAIREIIANYTREAGVRNLERVIAKICRKAVKKIVAGEVKKVTVSLKTLPDFIGAPRYEMDKVNHKDEVGVARGLAWTSVGGDTLSIEAAVMPGIGKIELTGSLGDVMKESARAAISYVRANAEKYHVDPDIFKCTDIHIHAPQGGVQKDGPSAGITLATAMFSAITNRKVRSNVAMTGEITIRGRVLPIGGLKEKSIAAYQAGVDTILFPQGNVKDLEEVPDIVKEKIEFIPVSDAGQVFDKAVL